MKPLCLNIKMLNKGRFFLIFFTCFSGGIFAQVTFQKLYARMDSIGASGMMDVKQTVDGNYIMSGSFYSCHNTCPSDGLMIKTDANGDTLWTRKMGGVREDYFTNVVETFDGNYVFAGETQSFGIQATTNVYGEYIYLVKTNINGDTHWTKTYGGTNTDYGHNNQICDIKQTSDSGFIFIAQVNTAPSGPITTLDFLVIKTNSFGDTLWTKTYGTANGISLLCVQQTLDGGYIFVGDTSWTYNMMYGTAEGLVVKTDALGNIQWQKTYGGSKAEIFRGVEQTNNGDYIVCGFTSSFISDSTQAYMYAMRLNNVGDTIWTKIYGPVYNNRFLNKMNDSTYLLTGLSGTTHFGILAQKINGSNGNITFTKEYGSSGALNGVDVTNDGGFILATQDVWNFGSWYGESYVIKTDASGTSGCYEYAINEPTLPTQTKVNIPNVQIKHFPIYVNSTQTQISSGMVVGTLCSNVGVKEQSVNKKEFLIYPNPANNILNLECKIQNAEISIIDILGNEIKREKFSEKKTIDISSFSDGIYFAQIKTPEGSITKKIIIQR